MMNRWDQRYDSEEYQYGTQANDFLRDVAERLPPGRCLCLADGEGRNSVYLAGLGHQVTAVDASAVGLKKAAQLAARKAVQLTTRVADLADFEIAPNSWDTIISIYCHVDQAIRTELHARVVAGLRPGGYLVLEAYRPEQLEYNTGGPPDKSKLMSLEQLRQELAGLDFIHAVELEREVIEGRLHTGTGAVVQILAVKP